MVTSGKQAQEGGSWLMRISLAQVGKWILDLDGVAAHQEVSDPLRQRLRGEELPIHARGIVARMGRNARSPKTRTRFGRAGAR